MCSIFGSEDVFEFFELAELNSYRGTHSHSIALINSEDKLEIIEKGLGPMERRELPDARLYIGHQQAPTTKANNDRAIHPSSFLEGDYAANSFLWHNGIIKSHQVKKWQDALMDDEPWDTRLLQIVVEMKGYEVLSEVDGSFACMHYLDKTLSLFRNDNCPMFIKGTSFSSTMFEGAESIESCVVYNYKDNDWVKTDKTFKTKMNFYWSSE